MLNRRFDQLLADQKYLVILRGLPAEETVRLAQLAWDMGIEAVEVPIGEPHQSEALAATVAAGAASTTGCGEVDTGAHNQEAHDAHRDPLLIDPKDEHGDARDGNQQAKHQVAHVERAHRSFL